MGEQQPAILACDIAQQGRFEPLARSPDCATCRAGDQARPLVDAVYCLSLQEEDNRARQAAAHLHAVGLCRNVFFFRPRRGRDFEAENWASHREMARHALAHNHDTVLILEDDVHFLMDWASICRRAARAMRKLPPDWFGFFLGHWPMQAYFVAPDLLRVRSACTHAYIAGPRLLQWLARTRPLEATHPSLPPGPAVDTAIGNLPEMYALFPMVATQRPPEIYRHNRFFRPDGSRRGWLDFQRHRYWLIHNAIRPAEAAAVVASPLHWASMRLLGIGAGQMGQLETRLSRRAKRIRDAALLDDAYYLDHNPDVAPSDPLAHYLSDGDREGRRPHPLFDPGYYRRAVGSAIDEASDDLLTHYLDADPGTHKDPHPCFDSSWYRRQLGDEADREAPLAHYLRSAPADRKNPHPCFDETWYCAKYPDAAATGEAGLAHYFRCGWKDGRKPHPMFDPIRYLAENPDVAAAGVNAFEHYVCFGRLEGRAPWFRSAVHGASRERERVLEPDRPLLR